MKKFHLSAVLLLFALLLPLVSCGTAGDIRLISVTSEYPARPEITDADTVICLNFDNQTDSKYRFAGISLERLGGLEPERVDYSHTNIGLFWPSEEGTGYIFLNAPLRTGQYRLRCVLAANEEEIKKDIVFYVIKRASRWNAKELALSTAEINESEHISMVITNPDTIIEDRRLDIGLESERVYKYGTDYSFEVFLGGQWYELPHNFIFTMPILHTGQDQYATNSFSASLDSAFGPLPAGHYRLVKEFEPQTIGPYTWSPDVYLPETICVEFTLEQDMI